MYAGQLGTSPLPAPPDDAASSSSFGAELWRAVAVEMLAGIVVFTLAQWWTTHRREAR